MLTAQWYNGLWSRPIFGMFRLRPRPAPPGRPLQLVVQPRPGPRPSADARLARSPPPLRAAHGPGGWRPPVTPGPSRRIPWATVSRETEPAPATDTGYETHLCGRLWGPCTSPTTTGQMLCPAQHWALLAWVWVGRVRGHQESRVEGLRRGRSVEATAPHWRGRPMHRVAPA